MRGKEGVLLDWSCSLVEALSTKIKLDQWFDVS